MSRPLSRLDEGLSSAFVRELRELNEDGYGRIFTLIGIDPQHVEENKSAEALRESIKRFSSSEEGPVRLVSYSFGDSPHYIFVPRHPPAAVLRALEAMGITPTATTAIRDYKKLRKARLEELIDHIVWLAGQQRRSRASATMP